MLARLTYDRIAPAARLVLTSIRRNSVEEFIARENIRRFEAQLDSCTDPEQRKTLLQLLETERRRLSGATTSGPDETPRKADHRAE